jgi:hypothetical protein
MHVTINVKSPNNIIKWHMGFNSAFKGLIIAVLLGVHPFLHISRIMVNMTLLFKDRIGRLYAFC